jgi:hypothetical protein
LIAVPVWLVSAGVRRHDGRSPAGDVAVVFFFFDVLMP